MRTETITVFGEPKGKARPRFFRGHAYTPKATREYEKLFAEAWGDAEPFEGAIYVNVAAFFKIPKSATKATAARMRARELLPLKKPDTDNVIKSVLDGLNGVAYRDDSQVAKIKAFKVYDDQPRVEVTISELVE